MEEELYRKLDEDGGNKMMLRCDGQWGGPIRTPEE